MMTNKKSLIDLTNVITWLSVLLITALYTAGIVTILF